MRLPQLQIFIVIKMLCFYMQLFRRPVKTFRGSPDVARKYIIWRYRQNFKDSERCSIFSLLQMKRFITVLYQPTEPLPLFKYYRHNYWQLNGIDHMEHFTKIHAISVADIPLRQHCLHIYVRSSFTHLKKALLNILVIIIHQRVWCC